MMLLSRKIMQFGLILALAVIPCLSANAYVVATSDTELVGYGNVGTVAVHAVVTKEAGSNLFTYSYDVTYVSGTADIHIFGVENPNDAPYVNAWNSPADANMFTDPTYAPGAFIEWLGINNNVLAVGGTRQFGYQSTFAPMLIPVYYSYAIDGGDPAEGFTLGIGTQVPEPGTLVALALGIAGIAPSVIRRRK